MSFNDFFSNMDKFDKFNRQMEAMDKWNNIARINERMDRLAHPLGKQWEAMEKFDKVNRQMEAIEKWNNFSKINDSIERLIYPMGKQWAEMEKFERSQRAWSKSIAALSPTINVTHDYFSKLDKLLNPPGWTALQKSLEIETSINKMSSILTATAAIEKDYSFVDKFTRLNDFASSLAVDILGEIVSVDNFQSSLTGLHEKIDELRSELKNEKNSKDLLKLFDRWIAVIGIIVGLIGIYCSVISLPSNAHASTQELSALQQDTLKGLRQLIVPSNPKRIYVTNRKCKIHSTPSRSSIIVDSIGAISTVDVIVLRQKWACVSYYVDDSTFKSGWVDKNYIDTLKGVKRSGNQSLFNR